MPKKGVYLAPSQFETGFICDAMSEEDIKFAIKAADESFAEIVAQTAGENEEMREVKARIADLEERLKEARKEREAIQERMKNSWGFA